MKASILILSCLLCFSCNYQSQVAAVRIVEQREPVIEEIPYQEMLRIEKSAINALGENLKSERLYDLLCDKVFPYWYGTKWDFNGISEVPGEGHIACGYFVSTSLRDAGFNLNRYKVAQLAASDIIKTLCPNESIKRFSSKESLIENLKNMGDRSLFIVGLDYHVGFIKLQEGELYFVHSDYYNREGVKSEVLSDSWNFAQSNSYVVGQLLPSDESVKKYKLYERY